MVPGALARVAAPMSYGRALGTVGLDRGSDLLILFLFLVVSLPFVASTAWVGEIVAGAAVLVALLILALAAARVYGRA